MLIYSEDRYVPTDINMMVIRGEKNTGYFYIHRLLYDQAVVLYDIYNDDIEFMINSIIGKSDMRDDVAYFLDNVPAPLCIFGPFLLLVKEPLTELKDMVGAIHVMSMMINFRGMLKVPEEIRNKTPRFSLSIREEYELAWDRFFQTTLPYSVGMFQKSEGVTPMNGVATSTVQSDMSPLVRAANTTAYLGGDELDQPAESFDDIDMSDADAVTAAVNAMSENAEFDGDNVNVSEITSGMDEAALTALMSMQWNFDEPTEDEESGEVGAAESEPAPEPEPEPEPAPEPEKKLSGIDALLQLA